MYRAEVLIMRIRHVSIIGGLAWFVGCSAAEDDRLGHQSLPVFTHSTTADTPDTAFPQVGWIGNCTATLIAPDVVLTATHCLPRVVNGCDPLSTIQFRTGLSGRDTDMPIVRDVVDFAAAPSSFVPRYSECPTGVGFKNCNNAVGNLRGSDDVMLLRLASPITDFAPMRVLTSIEDNVDTAFGAHATADFWFDHGTYPTPTVVGWGNGHIPANGMRRAGIVQWESASAGSPEWRRGCVPVGSCEDVADPRPDLRCSWSGLPGGANYGPEPGMSSYFMLRTARTSSAPGVWDGPFTSSGDSGGPLVVQTPGKGNLIWGVLHGGSGAGMPSTYNGTDYQSNLHSATFSSEIGRWIEKTLQYWTSPEYANRTLPFSSFAEHGGVITSSPGAAAYGTRPDAFVRGSDGKLWHHRLGLSPEWNGPIGGSQSISGAPAAVRTANGRIDVVARDPDGSIKIITYQDGSGWSDWTNLGGVTPAGTAPAIASWGPGRLDVFAIGTDRKLYHQWWDLGVGWNGWWEYLGPTLSDQLTGNLAAISWGPGRIDVFARTTASLLVQLTWENTGRAWQGGQTLQPFDWTNRATDVASSPAVASWMPGRLDLFYRDSSGAIRRLSRTDGGWRPTADVLGSVGVGSLGAVSAKPGRIDLYTASAIAYPYVTTQQLLRSNYPAF